MNFPFFKTPRVVRAPRPPRKAPGLTAIWIREPSTGRLVQSWREADDQERSCTARPSGPRLPPIAKGGALRCAA